MAKVDTSDSSEIENLFPPKEIKNPWVVVGMLGTAGILTAGIVSFKQGNSVRSQKLMRARIVAQGVTVGIMMYSVYAVKENQ